MPHSTLAQRATDPARRRPLASLAAVFILLLLAVWAVPPLLDGGRYRAAIAAIAAARLGRPVVIAGDINLRLLPQAVLTADDVTLPDQGDGLSVQVPALRLQLATLPLLAGRLVLRDLVLSAPVLRLPWAVLHMPPGGIGRSTRPSVPHAFAARIENGTLRLGQATISGISAAIHGGPAITGAEPAQDAPAAAFGAEGFASAGGRRWRFAGALGAPDADGVSAVDLSVRGQDAVAGTGGTLRGTLADGAMQGRVGASGTDLSLLLPASRLAWTAEAPFVADAGRIEAGTVRLSLGGAPADGAFVVSLNAPARLDGRLHAAALDMAGWAALLGSLDAAALDPPDLRLALSADRVQLLGGQLADTQATLVAEDGRLGLDQVSASLPGGAHLDAAALRVTRAGPGAGRLALAGQAKLAAPDLRTTLAWLRPWAPAAVDALPPAVLRQADMSAQVALQAGGVTLSGLAGRVDGQPVSGSLAVRPSGHPMVQASLVFDQLALDPWLAGWVDGLAGSVSGVGKAAARVEAALHVEAAHAGLRGLALDGMALDVTTGPGGVVLGGARASLAGAAITAAGQASADGRLTGLRLGVSTPALERLWPLLPAAWQHAPGLWSGAGSVQLAADGPPDALALQLRADAADLVLEADSVRNAGAGTATTTLTLRHPGAPRLLTRLGLPQALGLPAGPQTALHWLDTGSLTLRAHIQEAPGRWTVQDFDLDAAALRLGGQLTADRTARTLTGRLDFEQLALPDSLPDVAQWRLPAGWSARLRTSARSVAVGLLPVAADLSADLALTPDRLQASGLSARLAGGRLGGELSADLAQAGYAAHLTLAGARIGPALTDWPTDLAAGTVDGAATLAWGGIGWPSLSGDVHATLRDATATGLDLAGLAAGAALHGRAGRAAVQAALAQGSSPGLSGQAEAIIVHGRLVLAPARLASADGAVGVSGGVDLAGGSVDLRLVPAPGLAVRISGPWRAPEVRRGR